MAYIANVYQGNHIAATDLQNIENNFEYLRRNFIADGAPPDPGGGLEGVIWYDDNVDTLKVRDSTSWRGIFSGEASFRIWAYLDAIPDGWSRDTGTTDMVLALKGGAAYTVGGIPGATSSWEISGITVANHANHIHSMQGHTHTLPKTGGSLVRTGTNTSPLTTGGPSIANTGNESPTLTHTPGHTPGWRIRGATGILLYPKM